MVYILVFSWEVLHYVSFWETDSVIITEMPQSQAQTLKAIAIYFLDKY